MFFYLRIAGLIAIGAIITLIWSINHRHNATVDAHIKISPPPIPPQSEMKPLSTKQTSNLKQIKALDPRLILLNQWQSWCKPCVKELPSFDKLQSLFDPSVLQVLLVNTDTLENLPKAKSLAKELNISHASVNYLGDETILTGFRTNVLPATWLIDTRTKTYYYWPGSYDWSHPSTISDLRRLAD